MKKLFVVFIFAIFLFSGCVANEKNDPFYGETPAPTVTATPEATETPVATETPEASETPVVTQKPLVTATPENTNTATPEITPINLKGIKKYVIGDKVNVRKSNTTSSDKIAILYKGDEVMAYSSGGGWTFIGFSGGKYGYVSSKYLSTVKPSENTPEITPTATVEPTLTPTVEPTSTPTPTPTLAPSDDDSFDLPDDPL